MAPKWSKQRDPFRDCGAFMRRGGLLVLGGLMALATTACKNDMVEVIYIGGNSNTYGPTTIPVKDSLPRNPYVFAAPEQTPGIAPAH